MDLVRQVEAKYPALLFKQQLTAFVEGLYGMIRDNVKKEISSALSHVIQVASFVMIHQVRYGFIFLTISRTDKTFEMSMPYLYSIKSLNVLFEKKNHWPWTENSILPSDIDFMPHLISF
jgi:hypothetical protein